MTFMFGINLHSQESNKVLLIIRDGSGDLGFMLNKEVKIMQETIEKTGFTVEIATLSGEPISAGLLKNKRYASAIEFSDSYFVGSTLSGLEVVKDGNIMTSGVCPFMARRDEIQDGIEELAITLVKALKNST